MAVLSACANDPEGGAASTPSGVPTDGTAAPPDGAFPPTSTQPAQPANPVTPVMASGDVVSTTTLDDGTTIVETSDGTTTTTSPDGTITAVAADGTTTTTLPDGTVTTVASDGTTTTVAPDGTTTTVTPDGTITTIGPDGTVTTTPPSASAPGEPAPTTPDPSDPGADAAVWINSRGRVDASGNGFGIQGDWYAFGDGVTTTQSGNPWRDGMYCVTGEADGDSANWGAGIGFDLNGSGGVKQPYAYEGKLTGFRIKFTGQVPAEPRLHFVVDPDLGVNPFIPVTMGQTVVYDVADAQVPFSWGVDNAGQRVEGELYAVQVLAPGDSEAGPIDLCIEEFEPIYDEGAAGPGVEGTTYINSDGYVTPDSNSFGLTGPIYVISDGVSTAQSGVPFSDGRYCVAGEFDGSEANWGAGIAFDLSKPPGGELAPFDPAAGGVAAFRVGLSGSTPGKVRIQYVVNDPPQGDQPFLLAQMNTTAMYPIDWAQVPSSWDVSNAGTGVGSSIYTMQVYIEGDVPGPFEVCVEALAPLAAEEMSYGAGPAADGYNGFRTIDPGILAQEYELWKGRHFLDCGDGSACIPRDEGDCISEGVAYGLLLAVGNDDQDAFDKLWSYFAKHKNGAGMMKWQTNACGAATAEGSATDGDLDAAMALIQAGCRWGGNYAAEATTLLGAIANNAVASCSTGAVLKPGDNFGGCNETDPSYITPAYYRVFQRLTGNSVWNDLLESGYGLLAANQQRKGGLWSDWSNETGGVSAGNHSDDFGPDASRVPWRLATDYAWFGEERAASLLDTFRSTVERNGGPAWNFTPNSNYRGGTAFSAIHTDAATAHEYTDAWLQTSVDDETYFPGTLRPLYMLLGANQFPAGCTD